MAEKLLIESLHDNQVVRLTLNAPKGNILDGQMMSELQSELDALTEQPEVKLLQFTGAGDHFSFGASVEEHTREKAAAMLKIFHQLFYTLAESGIPTAALVSGQCLGGGLELALMCNLILADSTAKLGQPEVNLGVFPPPASLILPMKIGQAKADELLLTGKVISAEQAESIGLVAAVYVDREVMLSKANHWVEKYILPKSAASLRFATKAARFQFNEILKTRLGSLESYYLNQLMESHDANEGINSFLEHRKPKWQNK